MESNAPAANFAAIFGPEKNFILLEMELIYFAVIKAAALELGVEEALATTVTKRDGIFLIPVGNEAP